MASFAVWLGPSKLFQHSTEPILTTWQHWFMGDMVGFAALGPFVIGLFAAVRQPPKWRESIEGIAALIALAFMTAIVISLSPQVWQTLVPVSWLFPLLFWLAARCRPVFAAAAACMVSITIVWATVFGIGHFGNAGLSVDDRNLQAQATILVVALGALILAALFAERRESEALLARSNITLARERDNKLLNFDAITASIAHEIRQPLAAIVANAGAALGFLKRTPPDLHVVRESLTDIIEDGHRTGKTLDGIRSLFRNADRGSERIDVNRVALDVLHSLQDELHGHGVAARAELASELPLIDGNENQLHQVLFNLAHNALEAMSTATGRARVLRLTTERRDPNTIVVAVQDSGPGIDPKKLDSMFEAFVTTKANGMGLGLAICREIIERHGGSLSASSDGKNGALFEFNLPVKSRADEIVTHV
jgi:signal transduction histidine kinase